MEIIIRMLKCFVWSTLIYGCKKWTMNQNMKRTEAVEMWLSRRMLRIPWTARVTNEEVLKRTGMERSIMKCIIKKTAEVCEPCQGS